MRIDWRRRVGWWLRDLADRIDYDHGPRLSGWSFTFEPGQGVVFHAGDDNPGCPIAYMAEDYDRAHTEALSRLLAVKPTVIVDSGGPQFAHSWVCPNCNDEIAAIALSRFLDLIEDHCRDCPAPGRVSGSFFYAGRAFRLGR